MNELVNIQSGVMTIKSYPGSKFSAKLSKEDLKVVTEQWLALATTVKKHVEKDFYRSDDPQYVSQMMTSYD
jgi:pimeloyl-CoA synthetase